MIRSSASLIQASIPSCCVSYFVFQFGLVSLFNGMSAFLGYLMQKPSFQKNSSDTIQPIAVVGVKWFIPFSRIFSPKVNIITWLEYELTYFKAAVQHINHRDSSIYFFSIDKSEFIVKTLFQIEISLGTFERYS